MGRATLNLTWIAIAAACFSGCVGSSSGGDTQDCNLYDAKFQDLPDRFALGTTYTAEIIGANGAAWAESSNPEVVRLRRIDDERFELSFVGEGSCTITAFDGEGSTEHLVEVARHERMHVLLVEPGLLGSPVVPIGALSGKALVADLAQYFAVTYSDAKGALAGEGLAEVTLPDRVVPCELAFEAPLDLYCVNLEAPGPHVIRVQVGEEVFGALVGAVTAETIRSLVLLREDESSLEGGELVRVDAVGLTADGVTVHGLHPVFNSREPSNVSGPNEGENVGYFSYEYDPEAGSSRLQVRALNFTAQMRFRGTRVPPDVLSGCAASVWRKGGAANGILFLASLVFALRLQRRR